MTSKDNIPTADILEPQECWRLLAETSVGRLALTVDGHPDIFPVNYKVDGESLVFRTGTGTKQEAIDADSTVALEADSVSAEFGVAWSVVVRGKAQKETSPGPALDSISRSLFPWQGIGKDYLIRIVPESVTGRRFTLTQPMRWTSPLDEATRAGME
ncbi:pyridoxamine 5'-phosphate oxidase family protein [Arthrobacter methylotrophus]|uniref:Pyridoxamine 5'-phosphate oxidase family protein n=1 Tax=Arthrobacter methylotrophus TaxID=121291 RepID=A0ABV5UXE8_9MICC